MADAPKPQQQKLTALQQALSNQSQSQQDAKAAAEAQKKPQETK